MRSLEEYAAVAFGGLFGLGLLLYPQGVQRLLNWVYRVQLWPNQWFGVSGSQFRVRGWLVRLFGSIFVGVAVWVIAKDLHAAFGG